MELRHLRYFVAIAEEGSFTGAAERLWVAQPGLSTQIRRLERELGVQLFERHTRGVDLTAAGKLFLERARATLSAAEAALAIGPGLQSGVAGTVRLGLTTPARWQPTSTMLERFASERGAVELSVLEGYGGTLWRDLRDGRLDAVVAPRGFASPDLNVLELGSEPWVVLVGETHRLGVDGPLDGEELHGENIAVSAHRDGAGHDRTIARLLSELGVTAAMVHAPPGPGLHVAISRGQALGLTTGPEGLPAGVLARPLVPRRTLPFELLWRDETPAPALSEFVRIASDTIERRPVERRVLAAVA
jgi:DNA-binding transcriptional LysR family regulator